MKTWHKVAAVAGGLILAGGIYSIWRDREDLEEENDELYDEVRSLRKSLNEKNNSVQDDFTQDNFANEKVDIEAEEKNEVLNEEIVVDEVKVNNNDFQGESETDEIIKF